MSTPTPSPTPSSGTTPTIEVAASGPVTRISRFDLGANEVWYDGGYGIEDLRTHRLYRSTVAQVRSLGITLLRYPGGVPSDTFHWREAIGPLDRRLPQYVPTATNLVPSTFGPDEFGRLLDLTGAVGDITVNFETGTATEAADWVRYMTAPLHSRNHADAVWARLRARDGHPAPYPVPYWEVGNEPESSTNDIVSVDSSSCQVSPLICFYIYGGVESVSDQPLLRYVRDTYLLLLPPAIRSTVRLSVDGQPYRMVATLQGEPAGAHVFTLATRLGVVTFPRRLPTSSSVTASYESRHSGFLRYYQLMKRADPRAHICASFQDPRFVATMGRRYRYDCLVIHEYAQTPSGSNATYFHDRLMLRAENLNGDINRYRNELRAYFPRGGPQLLMTEYGLLYNLHPGDDLTYHRSLDMALFVAEMLRDAIADRLPVAAKHFLIAYELATPPTSAYYTSPAFAANAILEGPGPRAVVTPTGYVMQAFAHLLGPDLVASNVADDPEVDFSFGSFPALEALATTGPNGESVLVINGDPTDAVTGEVLDGLPAGRHWVAPYVVDGPSLLAENSPTHPRAAALSSLAPFPVTSADFRYTFPPHSLTVLEVRPG